MVPQSGWLTFRFWGWHCSVRLGTIGSAAGFNKPGTGLMVCFLFGLRGMDHSRFSIWPEIPKSSSD